MSTKWYVTDMDGTFLTSKNELYPTASSVVQQMTAQQMPFYIATGRLDLMIKSYYNELNLNNPVISCNGALIRNLSSGEIIHSTHFSFEELKILIDAVKSHHFDFHVYTPIGVYGEKHSGRIAYLAQFEQQYPEHLRTPAFVVEDVLQAIKNANTRPLKVLIIENDRQKVQDMYDDLAKHVAISGTFSGSNLFDIMKAGISKGAALQQLAEYYQYQLSDCVAFGDNDNDLSMLALAGTAIVPKNAGATIQSHADEIIASNDEGGVVTYLQQQLDKQ